VINNENKIPFSLAIRNEHEGSIYFSSKNISQGTRLKNGRKWALLFAVHKLRRTVLEQFQPITISFPKIKIIGLII
jgi:hypothetical protein